MPGFREFLDSSRVFASIFAETRLLTPRKLWRIRAIPSKNLDFHAEVCENARIFKQSCPNEALFPGFSRKCRGIVGKCFEKLRTNLRIWAPGHPFLQQRAEFLEFTSNFLEFLWRNAGSRGRSRDESAVFAVFCKSFLVFLLVFSHFLWFLLKFLWNSLDSHETRRKLRVFADSGPESFRFPWFGCKKTRFTSFSCEKTAEIALYSKKPGVF